MIKNITLSLSPEIAFQEEVLRKFILKRYGVISEDKNNTLRILRRSIDARNRKLKVNVEAILFIGERATPLLSFDKSMYQDVSKKEAAVIVGAGPAGLFAALRFIEMGIKPILLERGKDVRSRRRDLANLTKKHIVDPDSNYCFGEGGAGTYSDGKLYTRSDKRGDVKRILEILVAHGAKEEILIDAHPHIGTNKLPQVVAELRESILKAGGEIHFETKVVDIVIENSEIRSVVDQNGTVYTGLGVILATGHSSRDIFELLHQKGVLIEAKPFALGVRVEHSQRLIDKIQYHGIDRNDYLPAASYSLKSQVYLKSQAKSVYSFCMCPGGFIVPSATANGELVVNGMSPSRRNSAFANSGIVVSIDQSDWKQFEKDYGPLAALEYQRNIEQKACQVAGNTQKAPAQLLEDFIKQKASSELLKSSYQPGLESVEMRDFLPKNIGFALQEGFKFFGKKVPGYVSNEAQIIGLESRTSSPVRIPRDKISMEHIVLKRFFPCGEGAGYAGGIVSAAIDGELCAENLAEKYAAL